MNVMKKLLNRIATASYASILVLVVVTALGCQQEDQMSAWFFGDEELTAARLGVYIDEVTEVGGVAAWFPAGDENVDLYGVYGLHYFDAVELPFPPDANGAPLGAVPYLGVQTIMDLDYDAHVWTVTGVVFENLFFIEHQYDAFDDTDSKTMIGVRIRF